MKSTLERLCKTVKLTIAKELIEVIPSYSKQCYSNSVTVICFQLIRDNSTRYGQTQHICLSAVFLNSSKLYFELKFRTFLSMITVLFIYFNTISNKLMEFLNIMLIK